MGEAIIDIGEFQTGGLRVLVRGSSSTSLGLNGMREGMPAALRKTIRITAGANDHDRFIFGRIGLLVFDEGAVGVRSSLATERAL